jgi:hypothetical protein
MTQVLPYFMMVIPLGPGLRLPAVRELKVVPVVFINTAYACGVNPLTRIS